MKHLVKDLSLNKTRRILQICLVMWIVLNVNSCKPDNDNSQYQACLSGNAEIKNIVASLNGEPINFSHASIFIDNIGYLSLELQVTDAFPTVTNLSVNNIRLNDTLPYKRANQRLSLIDCDLFTCLIANQLLEGDTAFAEIISGNDDVHLVLNGRIVNDLRYNGCEIIQNQSFDTAHFAIDIVVKQ